MRLVAKMNDGTMRTIEAETAGDVYEALGAECGWYEGDGEVHSDMPVADVLDRDYGKWMLWATRDAMEGEHEEIEGVGETSLAQVSAAE
jgi:hypothetical protein